MKNITGRSQAVWPDWAIYWTLGNFSKPLATIIMPNSSTFLGYFCKGVKIVNFSSEIILGNFYRHLANFYWSHWPHRSFRQREFAKNKFLINPFRKRRALDTRAAVSRWWAAWQDLPKCHHLFNIFSLWQYPEYLFVILKFCCPTLVNF